jgi:glycosyltransferase involved in cell wall biosynthesis
VVYLPSNAVKKEAAVKFAIGVCVRNSERTIERAIESILKQTYTSRTELMQVIIVDGNSTDRTLSIIKRMMLKTSTPVEIFSDKGRGLGFARQMVIDKAKGDYVVFVDGDVEFQDDFIQKQIDFMEKNPQVAIAIGKYLIKKGKLISEAWNLKKHVSIHLGTDTAICRLKALRQVGGFDKNMKGASEDKDLIIRIQKKGWAFSINEEAGFYHDSRTSLREFWIEQTWFGFGNHYLYHKHDVLGPLWHYLPVGSFRYGLRLAKKGYGLTNRKISFLIPLLMGFGNIAWWVGFTKAHFNGYGHMKVS